MKSNPKIALIAVTIVLGACGKSKDGKTPDASKATVAVVQAKSDETAKQLEQLAAQKVEAVKDLNRLEAELTEAQKQPNNEAKIAFLQAAIGAREAEIKTIEARAATLRGEIETLQIERKKIVESTLTGVSGEVEAGPVSVQSTVTLAKNSFHKDSSLMVRLDADRLLVIGAEEEELATAVISASMTDAKELAAQRIPLKGSNGSGRVLDLFDVKLAKDGSVQLLVRTEIPSAKDGTPVKTMELLRLDSKLALVDRKVLAKNEAAESLGTKSALILNDDTMVWLQGDTSVNVYDAARKTMKACSVPGQVSAPGKRTEFSQIYRSGKANQIMVISAMGGSSEDIPTSDEIVLVTVDSKKVDAKNPCGLEVQSRIDLGDARVASFNRMKGSFLYQTELSSAWPKEISRVNASMTKIEAKSSDFFHDAAVLGDIVVGQTDKNQLERLNATSLEHMDSAWDINLAVDSITTVNEKSGLMLVIGEDMKAYLYDAKADAMLGSKTLPVQPSVTLKQADEATSTEALQEVHFARASGLRFGEKSDLVPVLIYPSMTGAVPEGTDANRRGLAKVIFVKVAQ